MDSSTLSQWKQNRTIAFGTPIVGLSSDIITQQQQGFNEKYVNGKQTQACCNEFSVPLIPITQSKSVEIIVTSVRAISGRAYLELNGSGVIDTVIRRIIFNGPISVIIPFTSKITIYSDDLSVLGFNIQSNATFSLHFYNISQLTQIFLPENGLSDFITYTITGIQFESPAPLVTDFNINFRGPESGGAFIQAIQSYISFDGSYIPNVELLGLASDSGGTLSQITNLPASLQSLSLIGNSLSSINLTPCINLQILFCGNNQLTSLDCSTLGNLTELFCESNNLSSINLGSINVLEYLSCSTNSSLTSLNISNLINLKELLCGATAITSLNLSNLQSLERLECENNTNLSTLNLSTLPQPLKLKTLNLGNTGRTNITVTSFTNLENLYIDNNSLSTLNVSANTKLVGLSCSENQLLTLDITGLTMLTYVNIENNNIDQSNADAIAQKLNLLPPREFATFNVINQNGPTTINITGSDYVSLQTKGWTIGTQEL